MKAAHCTQASNGYLCRDCAEYDTCKRVHNDALRASCPVSAPLAGHISIKDCGNSPVGYYNSEGYADPTAYKAFRNIEREERRRARKPRGM